MTKQFVRIKFIRLIHDSGRHQSNNTCSSSITKFNMAKKSHVTKLLVVVHKFFVDGHLTTFDFSVEFHITKYLNKFFPTGRDIT